MGFISTEAENYLSEHYYPDMKAPQLSVALDIPGRTARRYLRHYRDRFKHQRMSNFLNIQVTPFNGVVFDIETTDFGTEGYAGYLICCSFVTLDSGKVETLEIRYDDFRNDRRLLIEVARKLSQYPLHIGHNIAAYDYNWLNTRLRYYRLPTLDTALYVDTYQAAKAMALKTSKSLGNMIDYFGLQGVKTTIYKTSWSMIMSPNETEFEDAVDEIVYHCEMDVLANKELFNQIILPYGLDYGTNPVKISKIRGNAWKMVSFGAQEGLSTPG